MRRRMTSSKMANVVHQGWLTKSPPERKLRSHFKMFRSHWKKRYFVLRKPSGSLPGQYELHYYKDQRCNNKKGSIDLDQCEQIIEALDSEIFPFLLAIKTSYKHKVRLYYLAADTENDMNTWVQWLCHVCGLKPEDQPTDIPDPKPGHTPEPVTQTNGNDVSPAVASSTSPNLQQQMKMAQASPLLTVPRANVGQPASVPSVASTGSDTSLSYTSPGKSVTGQHQSANSKGSIESIPEFEAPPLPQKRRVDHNNGVLTSDDEVFVPSVYDYPPAQRYAETLDHRESSNLHMVPRSLASQNNKLSMDQADRNSSAKMQSSHGHSHHTSLSPSSESWTSGGATNQAVTCTEGYDYPHRGSFTSLDSEVPPERPPKSSYLQSPYQNIPPTGKVASVTDLMNTVPAPLKFNQSHPVPGYDIPRPSPQRSSHLHHTELSHVPTAPLKSSHHPSTNVSSHPYLNTTNRPGSGEIPQGQKGGNDSSDHAETGAAPPAVPPPRSGLAGEPLNDHTANLAIYQSPPSSTSLSSGSPARPPGRTISQGSAISPRMNNGNPASSQPQEERTTGIFSTKRTRSFKSPHSLKNNVPRHSPKNNAISLSEKIPAPRPVLTPRPKEKSTSEEDEHGQSRAQEEETHHPLSLLRSIPAPSMETDRELKYIDLDMPDSSQESPRPTHAHGYGHSHSHTDRGKEVATEYREIDFVKTQALNDTKRVKEKQRKNDDNCNTLAHRNMNGEGKEQ